MSDAYLGEIRMFAGLQPPQYWQFCNGQILNISGNEALYSLIGVTYGGNGSTTFALPDLRGRVPVGQGTAVSPPLSPRTLGQTGGVTTVTLTAAQMPTHTHQVMAANANATADTPSNGVVFAGSGSNTTLYTKVDPSDTSFVFDPNAVSSSGGSLPHDNVMASRGINFIICVNGLFPSRP
jgi:microcystin-dependent protein